MMIDLLDGNRDRGRATLMDMDNRCAINQQAEQLRATLVSARIHHALALVDH